jgi:hypothetical protein
MSNIKKGDILVADFGDELTVIATSYVEVNDERVDVFITKEDCCGDPEYNAWTEAELKEDGYKVKGKVKEMTVEQISKKLGYEVKVIRG